ncbi:MAG: lipoate--protein ligase family protein [bacterium]|nr:lipoate--protein ligase family protein [bacterium]
MKPFAVTSWDLSGDENMRRDLALVATARKIPSVMRLYTWDPWCVSLGHNQQESVIDDRLLREQGWDLVRRPTGGRAVLHAEELTYCIAVPQAEGVKPRDVYERIHEQLLSALQTLVPTLSFEHTPTDLRHHYATAGAAAVSCFTSSARSEIMFNGLKVVGSAQRTIDGVILQHGSILTGAAHMQIVNVLAASEAERQSITTDLQKSAVSLSEAAGRIITAEEVAAAILKGGVKGL